LTDSMAPSLADLHAEAPPGRDADYGAGAPDHIGVWADQRANGGPGSDPAEVQIQSAAQSVTGSLGRVTELTRHLRVSAHDGRRS
jgi:hypothetical protein